MSCERYRKTLAGLAAGESPSADVEAHLAACAACRAELASLREALALADATLDAIVAHQPGPQLAARIRQAVAGDGDRQSSWLSWRWTWAAATGLALLVAGVWYLTGAAREGPSSSLVASRPADAGDCEGFVEPTGGANLTSPATAVTRERRPPVAVPVPVPRPGRLRVAARARTPEPTVLVPASEREALLRFAAEMRERTVGPDSLLVADPLRELPEPEPIRIEPLEIAPLAGAGRS